MVRNHQRPRRGHPGVGWSQVSGVMGPHGPDWPDGNALLRTTAQHQQDCLDEGVRRPCQVLYASVACFFSTCTDRVDSVRSEGMQVLGEALTDLARMSVESFIVAVPEGCGHHDG